MIDLMQIDSTDTVKKLRTHLNREAQVINETQPCIGMAISPTIEFYKFPQKLLATCESENITNKMFLLCFPYRTNAVYVAQAWGELVLNRPPTFASGVTTLLDFEFARISIPSVEVPTKKTQFRSFQLGSTAQGSSKLNMKTDGLIREPTYSLGSNLLLITETRSTSSDAQYVSANDRAHVESRNTTCSIVIEHDPVL